MHDIIIGSRRKVGAKLYRVPNHVITIPRVSQVAEKEGGTAA